MSSLALRMLSRMTVVAGLALPIAGTFFTAEPALALCKYGGPHCVKGTSPKYEADCWSDPSISCDTDGMFNSTDDARRTPGPKKVPGGTTLRR